MENLLLDIRYAFRLWKKSPGFALVALLTLMLGIGANVVVFGVLNAILLRPLHVSDPQSLYQIRHKSWAMGRLLTTSYPAFVDFRQRNTTFAGLVAVYGYSYAELRWRQIVRNFSGDEVTGNYFDLLGVKPQLGRFFHAQDERGVDSAPFVVLSDNLWRSVFGADRSVLGTTVELDQHPFTVIGVTPTSFHGMERFVWPDYWIPMVNEGQVEEGRDYLQNRKSASVTVLGRLKKGVTAREATDNLNAIAAQLGKEYPETDDGQPLRLIHPGLIGDEGDVIRGFLYSVTVLGLLVLIAACANLASLFAARVADRSRELALRVALGAGRHRLVRQLLTEAMLISLLGGAAGLVTAYFLLGLLNRWPPAVKANLAASVDARGYLVGLALALGSALLFGMVPARQAWQSNPLGMIKGERAGAKHFIRFAWRDWLLGAQIAVCTLLVTSSLVAVRGLERAWQVPLGFRPQGALLTDVSWQPASPANDAAGEKQRIILQSVLNIRGVTAAGMVNRVPFTGGLQGIPVFRTDAASFKLQDALLAAYVFRMSPGYLETAGTRLLQGRDLSWHDTAKTPRVAIINQTLARRISGHRSALGQRFLLLGNPTEVVGVVEDGKYHDLQESPHPVVYLSLAQNGESDAILAIRSQRLPGEISGEMPSTLRGLLPQIPLSVQRWTDLLDDQLFPARAATVASGVMGLLAALLAVTGIFGMAAYSVSQRRKEFGIRVALGSRPTQLLAAALGKPLLLLGAGSMVGLLAGFSASRLLEHIVYQANPGDPVVLGGVAFVMAVLGLAASVIPARRALAANPAQLMREE